MGLLLDFLLGCSHQRTSFPMSPRRRPGTPAARSTYIVCLDCGKEFPYDWSRMHVGEELKAAEPARDPVTD